jgi:hypothetical protein
MPISQQAFADSVVSYVESSDAKLELTRHETQAPDLWVYRAEKSAMSGMLCLAYHMPFDDLYRRTVVLPTQWSRFCEQFYSPAARLLMQMYQECQQPSWLTWDPADVQRDDSPMTGHFWTKRHQNQTYDALRDQLRARGLTTRPTRSYAHDPEAFGVIFPKRVVDFPGTYRTLELVRMELLSDLQYTNDIPRDIILYGHSTPVLHMVGNAIEEEADDTQKWADKGSKTQYVVYVLSESRGKHLISRHIGRMDVSILEVAYGSVAGAIHSDISYLVPNELSHDEYRSFETSDLNWESHQAGIIKRCPAIAAALA